MNRHFHALKNALTRALGVALIATGISAHAVIGTLDDVPAATLLLPYFEVDLADPNGVQTRFTINNATSAPALAHVVLWSDLGVPAYGFDLYLGGYDVVEVDLRLLFEGIVPQTGADLGSPGPVSDPPVNFPGCMNAITNDFTPFAGHPAPDRLPAIQIAHLRAALTGQQSPLFGACLGADHGDQIARGYVTVDVVNQCSFEFPGQPFYFMDAGTGIAANANVLFGQYTLLDRVNRFTATSPLVAIEADAADPLTDMNNQPKHTFYGSFVGAQGLDNREPLGTVWQARTLGAGIFQGGTELIVWRDPGTSIPPFVCGTLPFAGSFPRGEQNVAAFDEQENGVEFTGPNPPFPWVAQRVDAGLVSPFAGGFVHLNLNTALAGSPAGNTNGLLQSFVAVRQLVNGIYSMALPATRLLGPQHQETGATSCTEPAVCTLISPVVQ